MPRDFMECTRTKGATIRTTKVPGGTRVICRKPGSKRWTRGEKKASKGNKN